VFALKVKTRAISPLKPYLVLIVLARCSLSCSISLSRIAFFVFLVTLHDYSKKHHRLHD